MKYTHALSIPAILVSAVFLQAPLAAQTGPAWTQLATAAVGTSSLHGMTYDSTRNRTVMFGGWSQLYNGGFRNETWEWDGATWNQVITPTSPSARSHCMLAFDSARNRTVMFGGWDFSPFGETWEYDGTTWLQHTPAHSPSPRNSAGLAYDAARGVTVLFGGDMVGVVNDETWTWDGVDWQLQTPTNAPSGRSDQGMCYDPLRQSIFVHRGYLGAGAGTARDLWEWDGVDWTLRNQDEGPSAGYNGGLVWHPGRQRLVACIWGGQGVETWSWDGSRWHIECATNAPSTRRVFQMAHHGATDRVVIFGGDIGPPATYSDTLLLDAGNPSQASVASFGTGCAGTAGVATLQALDYPMLGSSFTSELSNVPAGLAIFSMGVSDTQWGSSSLPQSLGSMGLPAACTAYVSNDVLVWVQHNGTASFVLPIPCAPGLSGVVLFMQGAGVDLGLAAPVQLVTSNAIRLTIGS